MNPMLNYPKIGTHECSCCGDQIEVDYSKMKSHSERVRCPSCNALYGVNMDAEFIGGVWTDKTKLYRI